MIYSERTISDLLAALSFSHISGRPQHPRQEARVIEAFKKTFPARWRPTYRSAQDQAGRDLVPRRGQLGQKNGHARIWAKTGTRPRLPADQRYANAYLFGAICPMEAKGAALMLPFANTRAMQMHLDEISCNVAAKAHGVA